MTITDYEPASMSTVTTLLWGITNPSAAISVASSEDYSVVLIGADFVSSLCRPADFALLCLVLLRNRDMLRTTLLFILLAQKRAGVGVVFRSVMMLAMTDLNLCTHKPPINFLCHRLLAKLSD